MPRLTRLLQEAAGGDSTTAAGANGGDRDDLHEVTAEQLFSESLLSQRLLQVRKQAAAICAAKPIRMSVLLEDRTSSHESPTQWITPLHNAEMSTLEDCIELAVSVALEGYRVLFLVSNLPLMSKLLATALHRRCTQNRPLSTADIPLSDALYTPLQRISLTQCHDVFQALSMIYNFCSTQEQSDGYRLLVLAPLCEFLGPFATSSGVNPTGEGMRRMLQLALKRARASAPVQTRVIQPSRDSDDLPERLRMATFDRNDDAQDYEDDDDVSRSRMTIDSERG
ncbi:hypothetical protein Gpo141_00000933 [Globisporangium polare]